MRFCINNRKSKKMNNLLNTNNSKATFGVNLPSGLPELMADMTREVLRDQPENFYEYIANYLEDMLRTRDHLQSNIKFAFIRKLFLIYFFFLFIFHIKVNQQNVDTLIDLSMTIADLLRETTDMSYHDIEKCTFSISTAIHRYRKNYGIKDIQKHHKFYEDSILKELLEKFNFNAETISYVQKIVEICFNDYFRRQQQKILDPNQLVNF